jgi:predicted pyridoxine 5'-phosphate oxidase superfamily flavin-nucleotide-binding protein
MTIKSDEYAVKTNAENVLAFVSKPANLIEILPQDRIENWASTEQGCSFKIKGLAHITLAVGEITSNQVVYNSAAEKPFPFKLIITIGQSENGSTIFAEFNPEVNVFMATMLKSPMTNFLNHLGQSIQAKYA